jgi:DNA-binding response OmpR family regulator
MNFFGSQKVMNILLIEDNPGDVKLIKHAFQRRGWKSQFFQATDGEEGLKFLHRQAPWTEAPRPDLVLLDLNIPKKDGRQILREIKSNASWASIPVFVLTSSELRDDLVSALSHEANYYFTKPASFFEYDFILKKIESLINESNVFCQNF